MPASHLTHRHASRVRCPYVLRISTPYELRISAIRCDRLECGITESAGRALTTFLDRRRQRVGPWLSLRSTAQRDQRAIYRVMERVTRATRLSLVESTGLASIERIERDGGVVWGVRRRESGRNRSNMLAASATPRPSTPSCEGASPPARWRCWSPAGRPRGRSGPACEAGPDGFPAAGRPGGQAGPARSRAVAHVTCGRVEVDVDVRPRRR